jgi:hypothetical protein
MNGAEQVTSPVLIVSARSGGSLKLFGAASVARISGNRFELMDDALGPQFVCDQPDDGETDEGDALAERQPGQCRAGVHDGSNRRPQRERGRYGVKRALNSAPLAGSHDLPRVGSVA